MRWGRARSTRNCTIKPNRPAVVRTWDSFCFVKTRMRPHGAKIGAQLHDQTQRASSCSTWDSFCFVKPGCDRTCKVDVELHDQNQQARSCPNLGFVLFRKTKM